MSLTGYNNMIIKKFIQKKYLYESLTTGSILGLYGLAYLGKRQLIKAISNRKIPAYEKLYNITNCNKLMNNNKIYNCKKYFLKQDYNKIYAELTSKLLILNDIKKTDKKIGKFNKENYNSNKNRIKQLMNNEKKSYFHKLEMLKLQYKS